MNPTVAPRQVILEHRAPRLAHLVCALAGALLTTVFILVGWFGLGDRDPLFTAPDSGWEIKLGLSVATVVGAALTLGFFYRLIKNPPTIVVYEEGFEYVPAGVSTGLIKFSDVIEFRDEIVVRSITNRNNGTLVTAVVLRNPDEYVRRFPSGLRHLMQARLQTNSSPILITPGEFGPDHDRIMAMIRERVAKAAGHL